MFSTGADGGRPERRPNRGRDRVQSEAQRENCCQRYGLRPYPALKYFFLLALRSGGSPFTEPIRSAMSSSDGGTWGLVRVNRSRTMSDLDIFRARASASICVATSSGTRTTMVFIARMYYISGRRAIQAGAQFVIVSPDVRHLPPHHLRALLRPAAGGDRGCASLRPPRTRCARSACQAP